MAATELMDAARKAQFDAATYAAINYSSDTLNFVLVTSTGDAVADATKQGYTYESDFNTNEVSGTGYTVRGVAPGSQAVTQTSHVVKITSANPSWSTATITASGGYLVKHVATAAASPAIAYYTFGGSFTSTAGSFTVTVNASGLISVS